MLLHAKRYWPDAINKMLWSYALKAFAEHLNEFKVVGYGITPMEKFVGTTIDITIKNCHTWGCPVYILDSILQGSIARLPKW